MSTPINYSKSILLACTFCLALLGACRSTATAQEIQWRESLDEAKAEAAETKRLVWLHFEADWCAPCKKLETFVFSDAGVVRTSDRNVVAVKIDADENDSLVRKMGVSRIPYDIVMTPEGEMLVNRTSPRNATDYLKMFDSLDVPLQALNTGNRDSINAGISQVQKLVEKADNFRKNKNVLELDGPSHQMAATTVEGQRLERGHIAAERAAEIRALEAKLLKQKAEIFIAQEESRLGKSQGPKVSENPFFKVSNNSKPSPSQSKDVSKTISNQFVVEQHKSVAAKPAVAGSDFLPPAPPTVPNGSVKRAERSVAENPSQYGEGREFRFAGSDGAVGESISLEANKSIAKVEPKSSLPGLTAQKTAELEKAFPELPKFKEQDADSGGSGDFAYAPIDELKKALKGGKAKPAAVQAKVAQSKAVQAKAIQPKPVQQAANDRVVEPVRAAQVKKASSFGSSDFRVSATKPKPKVHTDVAVLRPPVMVEGVVKIAETVAPAVEGRLVAGEQPIGNDYRGSQQRATYRTHQPVSRPDRMMEQVNFFAAQKPVVVAPPQVTVIQPQPVPQSQIVINLNTGASAQPVARNKGRIVQQSAVAQATATTASENRARILGADVASTEKSKFALNGKCPVSLLTQGQWVDGKKEIGCVHRDRVYLFASAENREAFLANPDQLSPLLAGFDPVIFEETGKLVEGEERFGSFMGDAPNQRIVLFKTADTRDRFQKEPLRYINVVRSAMAAKAKKNR